MGLQGGADRAILEEDVDDLERVGDLVPRLATSKFEDLSREIAELRRLLGGEGDDQAQRCKCAETPYGASAELPALIGMSSQ
jgi:hypothetical protein